MSSALNLWWLALPLLLLPLWWHRQQRQRTQAEPLATARFLPAAAPQQLRIWRWADKTLLALRLLLLLGVIAWLADVVVPWRGDTVLVGAQADPAWVEAQIKAAGLTSAPRIVFCADAADASPAQPTPAPPAGCTLRTADLLAWLAAHGHAWRSGARWTIVATADAVVMPAQPPVLAHRVELRLQPAATAASAPVERRVVLASAREAAWRALFTAFESGGLGRERYRMTDAPDAQTDLIVWDRPGTPDPAWRAPLWWAVQPAAFPEMATARRAGGLRVADAARGRLWAQERWPVDEADPLQAARALFEDRDGLRGAPLPWPAPTMTLDAGTAQSDSGAGRATGAAHGLLAPLLALLFALERGLAHRWARQRLAAATAPAPAPAAQGAAP